MIFADPKKRRVGEVIEEFREFAADRAEILASCGMESCPAKVLKKCDFAVVFGGDGSIIAAARTLRQCNIPVIGVNLGKLGFLAEFSVGEIKKYFNDIITGKATIEKRMMLGCKVFAGPNTTRERFSSAAINDVFITAGPQHRMIELKMAIDDQPVASFVGDGLIISTPTGSTAYNLSAGGPILACSMQAMVITPICPHSLSFRPIVVNARSTLEIQGDRLGEGSTISIDGQDSLRLRPDDMVRIGREGSDFLVVNNPSRTRWDTLATKLGWAEKPKYKTDPIG